MALYYDVRVDVNADKVVDSGFHLTQGDSRQIYLRVAVMNGMTKFNPEGATVTINFKKPDGRFVEGTPVASGDVYLYQILGNELQAAGRVLADIKFTYDSGRISSGKFTFMVDVDTSSDNVIKSTSYIQSLEQAKIDAQTLVGEITSQRDSARSYSEVANNSANSAESYAHGQTGTRPNEDTDNAMYYMQQTEIIKGQAQEYVNDFKYTHVRYSANPDGTDFVEIPTIDTIYTGIYTGQQSTAPTSKNAYTWVRNRGFDGNAYWATFDIVDGELEMEYNNDPGTITFSLNSDGELEVTT